MNLTTTPVRASLALLLPVILILPACVTYRPGTQPASHWAVSNSRQTGSAEGDAPVVISRRRVSAPAATPAATPAAKPVEGSGFLEDYARLEPAPDNPGARVWTKPGLDLREFDALRIDPIRIVPLPGSKVGELSDEMKQKATDAFRTIMLETISPYYDVVEEAEKHVLRVQLAITDLEPATEAVEGDPKVQVGGAALEAKLVNGATGEVLLTFVDRIDGSEKGTVAKDKWRPVEGAFREWSSGLLHFLDRWE